MSELRKDYFLDRWVLISPKRGARPHELSKPNVNEGVCYFCPGNEKLTPPEIGRVPCNGSWCVRWFENKFAALKPEGNPKLTSANRFFSFADGFGYQEIVVETPRHDKQLADLSKDDLENVLHVFARRIVDLESRPNIKYVSVFKNHGFLGGTSLVHSHSQIAACSFIPPAIQEKIFGMRRFLSCPYCNVIKVELAGSRKCFENDNFFAFCPYASRYNYEVWIFPKMHFARLEEVDFSSLADILSKVLKKLKDLGVDYNFVLNYGPKGEDFHFHIEVCPRSAIWAGFELGTGVIINSVAPEDAAKFYRGEE